MGVFTEFKEELNAQDSEREGARLVLGGLAGRIHGHPENSWCSCLSSYLSSLLIMGSLISPVGISEPVGYWGAGRQDHAAKAK